MKKQWVHQSNKKKSRQSDGGKLDQIQTHLTNLGYAVIREPHISDGRFSTRNHIRNPDLKVSFGNKFEVYIELDGKIHGTLEQPTDRTVKRNADFERTHMNYIIISEEDAKFFQLPLDDLAGYRVAEEYSKHLGKLENGSLFV